MRSCRIARYLIDFTIIHGIARKIGGLTMPPHFAHGHALKDEFSVASGPTV
jgi:hypothetical protein